MPAAMGAQKMVLMVVPSPVTARTAATAMSAMSSAYSRRSCPSMSRARLMMNSRARVMAGTMSREPVSGSRLLQGVDYETAASEVEIAEKIALTLVPVDVTASTATRAMRPTSRAYSSRS